MKHVDKLVETALKTVLELNFPVVITGNKETESRLKQLGILNLSSVLYLQAIPHSLVFPLCRCIIHHGGAGTTAAALYSGVPSIVIPVFQWSDQRFWALQIENAGCGILLEQTQVNRDSLRVSLLAALQLRSKCLKVSKLLESEGTGTATAANLIHDYCQRLRII